MPNRGTPTLRQRRLGAELRRLRTEAGRTTEYAGALVGLSRVKVSNVEQGVRSINAERVRSLAANYGCGDLRYVEALVELAGRQPRGWWDRYREDVPTGMHEVAELEWHAVAIRTAQTIHLPGLLQTEDYARAVFEAGLPPLHRLQVELRVDHRMQRQQILDSATPVPYTAFVHEAALRMQFGGLHVTRTQLKHLCDMAERPNVALRVLTVERGTFPGAGHALLYAHGTVPELDTVQLDTAHGPDFLFSVDQLDKYRQHLEWMDTACLTPEQSRDFIHRLYRTL